MQYDRPPVAKRLMEKGADVTAKGKVNPTAAMDPFHNSAVAPAVGARALEIERVCSRKQSKSAGARRFWKGSIWFRRSHRTTGCGMGGVA
jgi:hypothetical protein